MSQRDRDAILSGARALQREARSGAVPALLRGKFIGLVTATTDSEESRLFVRAAGELGARVAHIVPTLSGSSTEGEVRSTARMLGRLYDAVECHDTAHDLVQRLADASDVPVFEGISFAHHPTARLAELVGGESSATDRRKFVLQAVLVSSIP